MAKQTENTIFSLLTGIALGIGAGVLLAPESGKSTRKKLKKSVESTSSELKKRLDDISTELKTQTTKLKGSFDENLEGLLSKTSYKAEDVISTLEEKLKQLKDANAKLQK